MTQKLTARAAAEIVSHEAIVLEAYKDSVSVWTWGIGVTDASGHKVGRYKDNPQSIERVLEVYLWLLETKYLPDVLRAFKGYDLKEHELAAALSFHYNTGAIGRASWVKQVLSGDRGAAHRSFMLYNKPAEIIGRREDERDLFFDGKWSNDGTTTVWEVRKPSYTPNWSKGRKVRIDGILQSMLGGD